MQSYDIPLHDIKPLVKIEEYSFIYLVTLSGILFLFLLGLVYFAYHVYKKRQIVSVRSKHKKLLDSLSMSETKNTAYGLSMYGSTFKEDSPEHSEIFDDLLARLEEYKYKKSVNNFDDQTMVLIEKYRGILNV